MEGLAFVWLLVILFLMAVRVLQQSGAAADPPSKERRIPIEADNDFSGNSLMRIGKNIQDLAVAINLSNKPIYKQMRDTSLLNVAHLYLLLKRAGLIDGEDE